MAEILKEFSCRQEEEVKKFWAEKGIEKKAREKGSGKFYFMDGPPYATGNIHLGTALNKILKDTAMRSKRLQGYKVFDRPGYDTHGLPIENKVEKNLGLKHKSEIEEFGVEKFVKECRKFATQYIETMNSEFSDLGVWMDWENPYLTLEPEYIEAVWWTFKKADEKGLLYLGVYPVHVCPRCETAVAYNEIEYTKMEDNSIYVKFPLENEKNTFLLIWTTTPWTLPGNTGVMVHPDYEYVFAKLSNNETWIVAKELLQEIMNAIEAGYTIEKTVKGKELKGLKYKNPLEENLKLPKTENGYRVILSERYVTLEQGTGLVHCAPGHGKEDFEEGKKAGLPLLCPVKINGEMTEEAGKYSGGKAREIDQKITQDLEEKGYIAYSHKYSHDYPVCWRCKSPLLMISEPQWFLKISEIQKKLIEENKKTHWVPEWMKARMKNWLESLGDWPVSRKRYWGTPLPIWKCEKCTEYKVIGTLAELEKLSGEKLKDPHKPFIDRIKIKCNCGNEMKRIQEVLDVWFDSGISSWGALGYPQKKELFEKVWPADLNLEGTDQVRGWWNSQLIAGMICFEQAPYKSIHCHGIVLDVDKKKMSKSAGTSITPSEVINKFGRDYLRHYFAKNSKGQDISFGWKELPEIKRFFNIVLNSYNYYAMHLEKAAGKAESEQKKLRAEDKWILSKYNSLAKQVLKHYNSFEFWKIPPLIESFLIEDFSRNYIKLVRDRSEEEKSTVAQVFKEVFTGTLKLMAPITPHLTEYLYITLGCGESIHLEEMPKPNEKLIDKELEKEFALAMEIIQAGLSMREEKKLRRRWPLKKMGIKMKTGKAPEKMKEIIEKGCNVFQAVFEPIENSYEKEFDSFSVWLDTSVDKELKEEWEFRELIRRIQAMRKEKGLMPGQKTGIEFYCNDTGFAEKFSQRIEKETHTKIIPKKGPLEKVLEKEFYFKIVK